MKCVVFVRDELAPSFLGLVKPPWVNLIFDFIGYDYTLQILCFFFLCEEAKKILTSLQKKRRNAKEIFTYNKIT